MRKLFLILTLVIVSFAFLSADIYVKQQTKAGQQASIQETWLGTDKIASISDEGTVIMDMTKKKLFMIDHKSKTYIETTIPLDMAKLMPPEMASMMQGMMSGMEVRLSPNGKTKKIANWNAKGYDFNIKMMGMEMKMTMWASADVPFDWKKYAAIYSEIYKVSLRMGEKFMKEFLKMNGFPVATEMTMMGIDITTTTLEISKKTAGANVYSVPSGYKKKDKFTMEDMQK